MSAIINVKHLTKEFKEIRAVNDLSFTVEQGQVHGFLGQNGAGKSTTIRMLLTLIQPTSGEIELFGMRLDRHRKEILRKVGAIIERPDLYKYLSAYDNLRIFATMSGIRPTKKLLMDQLEMVGLADRAHSKVKTYSQGMKQRLGIATALVHQPELIILDEPTNGLDPQGIADIRNLIIRLRSEMGKTLLISSHLLSEMELIADSMIIIDRGRKVIDGKVNDLFDPSETLVELKTVDHATALAKIKASPLNEYLQDVRQDLIILKLHRDQAPSVIDALRERDINVLSFHAKHSLEDYFLSLTTSKAHA